MTVAPIAPALPASAQRGPRLPGVPAAFELPVPVETAVNGLWGLNSGAAEDAESPLDQADEAIVPLRVDGPLASVEVRPDAQIPPVPIPVAPAVAAEVSASRPSAQPADSFATLTGSAAVSEARAPVTTDRPLLANSILLSAPSPSAAQASAVLGRTLSMGPEVANALPIVSESVALPSVPALPAERSAAVASASLAGEPRLSDPTAPHIGHAGVASTDPDSRRDPAQVMRLSLATIPSGQFVTGTAVTAMAADASNWTPEARRAVTMRPQTGAVTVSAIFDRFPVELALRDAGTLSPEPSSDRLLAGLAEFDGSAAFATMTKRTDSAALPIASGMTASVPATASATPAPALPVLDIDSGGQWIDRLALEISTAAKDGGARLKLTPDNLGELTIAIRTGESGASVVITTQDEAVRSMVAGAQDKLAGEARSHGLRLADVQTHLSGDSGAAAQQNSRQTPQPALWDGDKQPKRTMWMQSDNHEEALSTGRWA